MKNIGVTQISEEMLCRSSETFLSAVGVLLDSNQAIYLAWSQFWVFLPLETFVCFGWLSCWNIRLLPVILSAGILGFPRVAMAQAINVISSTSFAFIQPRITFKLHCWCGGPGRVCAKHIGTYLRQINVSGFIWPKNALLKPIFVWNSKQDLFWKSSLELAPSFRTVSDVTKTLTFTDKINRGSKVTSQIWTSLQTMVCGDISGGQWHYGWLCYSWLVLQLCFDCFWVGYWSFSMFFQPIFQFLWQFYSIRSHKAAKQTDSPWRQH